MGYVGSWCYVMSFVFDVTTKYLYVFVILRCAMVLLQQNIGHSQVKKNLIDTFLNQEI